MTENTAKDIILDIIGRLRSRKARPDLENICHMALRKHSLSSKETEVMMNKLVEENIVIRVTYKGRTSYRNAAKCSKTRMHAELLNKKAATKLRSAILSQCSLKINNNNNNNINNSNNSTNGSSSSSSGTASTITATSTVNNTSTTNTTTTAAAAISNNNNNNNNNNNSHNNTKCGKHRNSVICNNNNNNNNNTNNNSSNNNSSINHSNNNSSTNNSSFCTTTTTTTTATSTTTTTTTTTNSGTDACSGGTCVHTGGEDPLTDNGDFTGLGTSPVKPANHHHHNNNNQDLVTTQTLNHNGGAGSDDGCNGEGCSNGTGGGGGGDNGNGGGVSAGDGVGDDDDDDDGGDGGVSNVAGVTREQIELWWHAQGFEPALAKIDLGAVIQNELLAKNIERLPSGYFVLTASGSTTTTTSSAFLNKVASLPPPANNTSLSSLTLVATAATTTTTSSTTATNLPTPTPTATNPLSPSSHQLPNNNNNNNNNNNDKNNCSSFASRPSTLKSNESSPPVANQGLLPPHTTTMTTDTMPADTKRRTDLVGSMNGVCGALTDARGRQSFGKNCLPKPPCKRGRPVSRRKKFLKTLGPDFQSELPVAIHGISKCDFCLRPASVGCGRQGGDGEEGDDEELLCCKDCNTKAHPSCMNYSPELALRAYQSPWQCHTCRVCSVCNNDSGNALAMLICDSCDKGFHLHCLYPPPTRGLSGQWVCSMCSKQDNKDYDNSRVVSPTHQLVSIKNESCTYGPPTPSDSPEPTFPEIPQDFSRKRSVYDGPYPDVTEFSIEDVVRFFQSKGFTKEAAAFSEQEIDGKSLLLMKRDDVLVGLRDYICLGPALKIFKHVERLQWASE